MTLQFLDKPAAGGEILGFAEAFLTCFHAFLRIYKHRKHVKTCYPYPQNSKIPVRL